MGLDGAMVYGRSRTGTRSEVKWNNAYDEGTGGACREDAAGGMLPNKVTTVTPWV